MHKRINSRRRRLLAHVGTSRTLLWIGRSLLILFAVLLVTMPFTQHFWTWDRFLHGGQDFESTTLLVLIVLSLVMVLCKHGKQCVDLLFAQERFLGFRFNASGRNSSGISLLRAQWALQIEPRPSPASGIYSIPLQI